MKTQRYCKTCNKEFLADARELNRGNALYCSLSCSRKIKTKKEHDVKCICCNNIFKSTYSKSKYCSSKCKSKTYRNNQKSTVYSITHLKRLLLHIPCEICGWKETTRDIHHILPVSKGGKNDINNLIVLCPNHHRMVHKNLINKDIINQALQNRIIIYSPTL